MALWALLAIIVFNVTYDWKIRMAGHSFVAAQLDRQRHGLALPTLNEGFRPLVRQAALEAGPWMVLVLGGVLLSYGAGRLTKRNA